MDPGPPPSLSAALISGEISLAESAALFIETGKDFCVALWTELDPRRRLLIEVVGRHDVFRSLYVDYISTNCQTYICFG